MRPAVSGGLPVRLLVGRVDDRVRPGAAGQRRDVIAAPDVELAPVRLSGRRGARAEGGDDAVIREPGQAGDPQPEKAAAPDDEKLHQGRVVPSAVRLAWARPAVCRAKRRDSW